MGCCFSGDSTTVDTGKGTTQRAFQGQGNRLGSANDAPRSYQNETVAAEIPQPTYDPNVSDADRDRIRAERAAAAEARLKAMGGGDKKKKKAKKSDSSSLRGPNTEPLMRWS
jgi:hypothetical protein